jgi:ubiquinone/menaquinone biosynthesis C-methylase UbiE
MFIKRILRVFFYLLYHPFAFLYDLVAAAVSFGRWQDWGMTVLPFIAGTNVLELGHGPGHLQRFLLNRGLFAVGLDESAQMGKLARRRLGESGKLTRSLAQSIPFADKSFQTIVATFPTEFIFDAQTLSEIKRCIVDAGKLIVLPAAWPKSPLLKWLYRVTGESPPEFNEALKSRLMLPFIKAGFLTELQLVEVKSSMLLIVMAKK